MTEERRPHPIPLEEPDAGYRLCPECRGLRFCNFCDGQGHWDGEELCRYCGGTGECYFCGGLGEVPDDPGS